MSKSLYDRLDDDDSLSDQDKRDIYRSLVNSNDDNDHESRAMYANAD